MEVKMIYDIEHYKHFLKVKNSVRYYYPDAGQRLEAIEKDLLANIDPALVKEANAAFNK